MAILNFPDNPRSGDQYTGDNGTTYVYDGVKWVGRALSQPAGTNSISNNGFTVQVDADGNLILPIGGNLLYADGQAVAGGQGPQGVRGEQGPPGADGPAGATGPRGLKGDTGATGAKGDPGDRGATGAQGVSVTLKGTKALIADLPDTGQTAGDAWIVTESNGGDLFFWNVTASTWDNIGKIVGPQGDQGIRGERGFTGDTGATGADGAAGAQGETGPRGLQGVQGPIGPGVAAGGTVGQVLAKTDSGDFNTEWIDAGTTDRLTNINNAQVVLDVNNQLVLPLLDGSMFDSGIAATNNIKINANGTMWTFASNGYLTLPNRTLAVPSRTSRNESITLFNFNNVGAQVNYGIGVSDHAIWMTTDSNTAGFDWYGGEDNRVLSLQGDGTLNIINSIKNGNSSLSLGGGVTYLTPVTDDFSALWMNPSNIELYTQGNINLSTTKPRTEVSGNNTGAGDNIVVIDYAAYPAVATITNQWTLYYNNTNYYVQNIQPDTPSAGLISFTVVGGVGTPAIPTGNVTFKSPVQWQGWQFGEDGTFTLPNYAVQRDTANVLCQPGVDTVIYTGTSSGQHTFKLLIKAEGAENSGQSWETQSTEMIIAKSFNGDKVAASAYGVVHTSVDPLATFSARWNATSSRVEVLCRPTSATFNVTVRTFATEIMNSD